MKTNSRGMSIVLIMALLLITGFVGTAIMKTAFGDRQSGIYFSSSESARTAAQSGLAKALARITSKNTGEQGVVLNILNKYANAKSPIDSTHWTLHYLCGSPTTYESLTTGSDEKFRTRIDAFNKTTFEITLVSEGIGSGGGKSTAVGVYKLEGLIPAPAPISALHLGQGAGEIVSTLKVTAGDVYVENPSSYFVGAGAAHEFSGLFRTAAGNSAMKIKNAKFYGQAYFKCPVTLDGEPLWFSNGVGFEKLLNPGSQKIHVTGGSGLFMNGGFLGGAAPSTCGPEMNGLPVYAWDDKSYTADGETDIADIVLGESRVTDVNDSMTDISDRLGITKPTPSEVVINYDTITAIQTAGKLHAVNTVFGAGTEPDGDDLTDAYNDSATYPHWKGFLVLTGRTSSYNAFGHDGTFDGKVIWIMDGRTTLYAPWNGMFEFGGSSSMLLILKNTQVDNFRLPVNFRGMIISEGGSSASGSNHCFFGRGNTVTGAIIIKDRIFRLQDDGGSFSISYSDAVINEFLGTKIIKTGTAGGSTITYAIQGANIRTELCASAF